MATNQIIALCLFTAAMGFAVGAYVGAGWLIKECKTLLGRVEVVRCKDCKNRFTTRCPMHHEEQTYNEDEGYDWIDRDHTSDDGFCDQGELATDDDL